MFASNDEDVFGDKSENLFSDDGNSFYDQVSNSLWKNKPLRAPKSNIIPPSLDVPPPINAQGETDNESWMESVSDDTSTIVRINIACLNKLRCRHCAGPVLCWPDNDAYIQKYRKIR